MGSIIGHRIDYNGVGVLRGQRTYPAKIDPSNPPSYNSATKTSREEVFSFAVQFLLATNQSMQEWHHNLFYQI